MTSEVQEVSHSNECQTLLGGLKGIVESLLVVNNTNVWSTVGGLSRLVNQLDKILAHGLREEFPDYWSFIVNLRQLQPTLAPLVEKLNRQSETQGTRQCDLWLQSSLEQLTVSGQLQILLASECTHQYYHDFALVCQPAYTRALLTCLRAIEHNDSCLLAELDYSLFQMKPSITRQEPAYSPMSTFRSLSYQTSGDLASRDYAPIFIRPQKQESVVSLSPELALGSTPPHNSDSAKDILESVLDINGRKASTDSLEKDLTADGTDPLLNRECVDLTQEIHNHSSEHNFRTKRPENGYAGRKSSRKLFGVLSPSDSDEIVFPKRIRESQQGQAPHSFHSGQDAVLEGAAPLFPVSPPFNRLESSFTEETAADRDADRQAKLLWETSGDSDDDGQIWKKSHLMIQNTSKGAELPLSPESDYRVNPFSSEDKDNLAKSMKQFGSVKARRNRRKLSSDNLSHHEKSLKRRNAHKRWHSEHITQKETKRILEDARGRGSSDQLDGLEQSSSLPDEEGKWYYGVQSPMVDGYFPQPSEGESLMSFLSSQDFATCPELDRENAHFCISEAIISAVEQIKCKQLFQRHSDNESDGSDEEIQALKQRIRIRRKERRRDRVLSEEGGAQASSPESPEVDPIEFFSSESESELSDNDGLQDLELTDRMDSNLISMRDGGLSTSLASLYSDADLQKNLSSKGLANVITSPSISEKSSILSAESIALTLLKKFSLKHLPRASELEWMVSEKDAPQELLPLPQSVPISPDDGENADLLSLSNKSTRLRGNMEWAPPRAQLIFNIHPIPKRKLIIAKQNYRCAGCGMKIERGFLKRLRYCHYLGKYFCQCCHTTNTTVLPSRILRKWDFTKMPVSNFSLEFLKKIHHEPHFNIGDINPHLYRKVRTLQTCQDFRSQLFSLKDFIRTCRLTERSLFSQYDQEPPHLLSETETYSMADLIRVRSGDMEKTLSRLVQQGLQHVANCELCQAKGFICEICKNEEDIIFPYELTKTLQCPECGSCYHRACYDEISECPKCTRIKKRKILLAQISESDESNQSNSRPETPDDDAR
ncbi:Run domain Beclin-1-interacting and cysteine-rich domain-containing protein [Holothuria leucospilota]|uniref:Run domain Beclin-1-interacting and cysteine-rich domain-containing protein n=1 Tax=Holothuria leucospilota TaxID=206669 RepID=A0A9Q1H2T3_HOLLE|nr:Run domain Beclin-1-interacting and cysteine-rich domain-containing protein [Holothuria leucospilota]